MSPRDILQVPLDSAPLDDEPDDDDFDGGLTEARADIEAGRLVPHDEVKQLWDVVDETPGPLSKSGGG